jgi:hypothetical protein
MTSLTSSSCLLSPLLFALLLSNLNSTGSFFYHFPVRSPLEPHGVWKLCNRCQDWWQASATGSLGYSVCGICCNNCRKQDCLLSEKIDLATGVENLIRSLISMVYLFPFCVLYFDSGQEAYEVWNLGTDNTVCGSCDWQKKKSRSDRRMSIQDSKLQQ